MTTPPPQDSAFAKLTPEEREAVAWRAELIAKKAEINGVPIVPEFRNNVMEDIAEDPKTVFETLRTYRNPYERAAAEVRASHKIAGTNTLPHLREVRDLERGA